MEELKTISRDELAKYLEQTLDASRMKDYCANGLQVEGRQNIRLIVSGVTASLALLEAAVRLNADAILVHHGYFWRGEDARIVGLKYQRLKLLLKNDISLFAYHLPLDLHETMGNNVQLAHQLGLIPNGRFGENSLGWIGTVGDLKIRTVGELVQKIEGVLGRTPLLIGDPAQMVGRIGWCTGAAQDFFGDAIAAGVNTYLSGEISEPTVHLARESGVAYLACGHHATERYGVQAVGQHVAEKFGIEHRFIEIDNPV